MFDWLPDLIEYDCDWETYAETLYSAYISTYRNKESLTFRNKPVIAPTQPEFNGKSESFWHIIGGAKNTPDLKRCERIKWARAIIEHCEHPEVLLIEEYRNRKKNILFWVKTVSYLVVLEERKNYFILKTAYLVDKPHKLARLERACQN